MSCCCRRPANNAVNIRADVVISTLGEIGKPALSKAQWEKSGTHWLPLRLDPFGMTLPQYCLT